MKTATLLLAGACFTSLQLQAQIWEFDLAGLAGPGLLGGNEPGVAVPSPASGGELEDNFPSFPSINYNTATHQLRIPIAWGSANSAPGGGNNYTDLTAAQTVWHLHGPVSSSPGDDINDYFGRSAGALPYNYVVPNDQALPGAPARSSGSIDMTITLTDLLIGGNTYTVAQQEQDLFNGRWYINIHSQGTYAGGEIRGQLLYVIPEPEHYAAFAGFALLTFAGYRRYKRNAQPA